MPTDPCPTAAEYDQMLVGRLAADRAAAVEAHLDGCAACQRLLDGLEVDARLTDALRAGPAPPADAPDLGDMVSRIEEMAGQFTPAGFDLSASADGDDTDSVADPTALGAYRVVRLLGAGGMGLVYLAEDELLNRQVAVKVLPPRLALRSAARAGFLREARAVAALKHDNVVTVFQVGEAPGPGGTTVPFLAMELLEGESLADHLRREGRVRPAWAARLGAQAAGALAAAHARGVVHRDVKPGNLWLEAPPGWADGAPPARPPLPAVARLKVLDFGLARPSGEDPGGGTRALGTPAYMPPEQARGEPADARSDVFGLGVVLYELVTGRLPFPRADRKAPPAYPPPAPVRDIVPDVPPALAVLIHRMIDPDPAARPQSAAEVAAALADDSLAPPARHRPARRVAVAAALLGVLAAAGTLGVLAVRSADVEGDGGIPPGPPDDGWCRAVAALPPDRQLAAVTGKLRELNPGFDGQVTRYGVDGGRITEFGAYTDAVADIRPVRALTGLTSLNLNGTEPGKGKLSDLAPIRGLPLTVLNVWQNPELSDLSPAAGMKLVLFQAGDTAVEDLSPLAGMPLATLAVNDCRVRDLTPVRTMARLRFLRCDGCPLTSLRPVVGSTVRELTFTPDPARDDETVLAEVKLDRVNRRPAKGLRAPGMQ
jgi:hypothetical protein